MPGNYRYEEERHRGQRGTSRRGFERGRDDDLELEERERYGPSYTRDQGEGRFQGGGDEGTWRRPEEGRDAGRSLGGRGRYEDDEDSFGTSYSAGGREANRYAGDRPGYRQGGYGQDTTRDRSWNTSRSQGARREVANQADGGTDEPSEMRWGRQQGLYGSSEYGGYISSQRSQKSFQSHVGKGPKNWQRSDERIREEVCEALARHPEIDASDIDIAVQGGEVTLSGTVTDRQAKRLAEDVAEDVLGVKDVQVKIRVQPSTERTSFGSFSERDVTPVPDRQGRITSEEHDVQSRRTGVGPSGGGTAAR